MPAGTKAIWPRSRAPSSVFRVADRCLQIHGGMGLATEMPISQMWRDARSFMITEGPVEVMRMVLAREIFRGQV